MNKIENILECDHIIEKRTKQTEMIKEMRENIIEVRDPYYTIRLQDMKRIANNVTNSIFDLEKCSIWMGYITNYLEPRCKGMYINFYFRDKKKVPLHRLLYENYRGSLDEHDIIKFNCDSKGACCNVHHMELHKHETVNVNRRRKKKYCMQEYKKEKINSFLNCDLNEMKKITIKI